MPLNFDLPYAALKTYKGSNPKPSDFDEFWEEGLNEMRSIDPELEFIKADFECNYPH